MSIRIVVESGSALRNRLIQESIDKAMQGINVAVSKLDHADKIVVYSLLLKKLDGRVSAKIRRKATNVFHKGARH